MKLNREQIKRLFADQASPDVFNGTPDSSWYCHPAMPWENIRDHISAGMGDVMIPVYDRRYNGLRKGEYDPEVEVKWRLHLMKGLTDSALNRRVKELSETNKHLQGEIVKLRGWG